MGRWMIPDSRPALVFLHPSGEFASVGSLVSGGLFESN